MRSRNNATQTHKSGYARWQNVDRLFLSTPHAANLHDKHILLVDDVLTTGATLVACADALLGVENIKISVLTFGMGPINKMISLTKKRYTYIS